MPTKQDADEAPRPRYYNAAKNPEGRYVPGVPLADMSAELWAGLPEAQRRDAAATGWWRLTPVPDAPDAPEPDAPAEDTPHE